MVDDVIGTEFKEEYHNLRIIFDLLPGILIRLPKKIVSDFRAALEQENSSIGEIRNFLLCSFHRSDPRYPTSREDLHLRHVLL
jgi:hypothetical protein